MQTKGESFDLLEVRDILRRRRLLWGVPTILGLAVGAGVMSMRAPSYTAEALILLEAPENHLSAPGEGGGLLQSTQMGTAIEVLKSRGLAEAVVDSLKLQVQLKAPSGVHRSDFFTSLSVRPEYFESDVYTLTREPDGRFRVTAAKTKLDMGVYAVGDKITLGGATVVLAPTAAEYEKAQIQVSSTGSAASALGKALEIEQPARETELVAIRYKGTDPELVRDVPNVLADRFMALRETMQKSEARNTVAFLRQQLDTLTVQLARADDALQSFRESQQVIDPQLEASTNVGHLASLQAEMSALEAERSALASLIQEVERESAEPGAASNLSRRLIASPSLLRNQAASEILSSLSAMENQRATLLMRRNENDPDVQILSNRILDLERQLRAIAHTYEESLESQVMAMRGAMGAYQSDLSQMPARQTEFARLSRQPRVLQAMYELLQTRLKEAEITQAVEDPNIRIMDVASLPRKPSGLPGGLFVSVFGMMGLFMGISLAFVREYADSAVHSRRDVKMALRVPVLTLIPAFDGRQALVPTSNPARLGPGGAKLLAGEGSETSPTKSSHVVLKTKEGKVGRGAHREMREEVRSTLQDAYNRLYVNLNFLSTEGAGSRKDVRSIIFTSALAAEGKTTTATDFALTMAQGGLRVLLIDADLRGGRERRLVQAAHSPGLSELLGGFAGREEIVHSYSVGSGHELAYIPAGELIVNSVPMLESAAMRELLEWAALRFDRVIIDSPPLAIFPDAAVLSQFTDAVVIVVRAGETSFEALAEVSEQLERIDPKAVGAILNAVDFKRDASYDRSYRWYGKGYTPRKGVPITSVS